MTDHHHAPFAPAAPASVVLVTGIMAAGKSTVAQALAERLPRSAHVRGDAFRRMLVSGRADMGADEAGRAEVLEQLRLRHRIAAHTADLYAEAGWTAIVQDIVIGEELPAFVSLVRTRPLYVVVLAPDASAVAAREEQRPKTGYGLGWTPEGMDALLRAETPRIGLWLDSAGLTPAETVDAVMARAGEARVE
ncbi:MULTISPECIES: AAA family ATPase [Streptomyces]|uniref:Adenylyl-sulfate kinase n=1 Tax=Streptomyces tsukubensis (strain DSM 42081 / NBRC 108919 / NRRL 18488 / 9993) TaxID=1114943 RepID=I2MYY7_STRT9|nr:MULTISPECIES: AAA family ATPase [Streptomyces]AZK94281.1 phosphotransferase [Streptomyces tsukubensis]EIF89984.1 phosphotransferase [Streptomyces tsukubensis NRRL18488]MYS66342.1 AAA family ATPase [Streptomyces sp. SID5473]QKM69623.1 adenylyl-sulfate kinase [Streptomyces tsukubensis NRRL18488]TAI46415.1 adenylyl-sulfate kinase [Streptomyces tsukubensis]